MVRSKMFLILCIIVAIIFVILAVLAWYFGRLGDG